MVRGRVDECDPLTGDVLVKTVRFSMYPKRWIALHSELVYSELVCRPGTHSRPSSL